jgi:hypothetical protein
MDMKSRLVVNLSNILLVLVILLSSGGAPVRAQEPPPPQPGGEYRTYPSERDHQTGQAPGDQPVKQRNLDSSKDFTGALSVLSSGGPDDYGYTFASGALAWKDAVSGGTNSGLKGTGNYNTALISLPFSFKFYENTYSGLYISRYGYISFSSTYLSDSQSKIPSPYYPNDVIAPYWVPLNLGSGGTANQVWYKKGGTAPNRYFIIEWNQVVQNAIYSDDLADTYTFELVLYENGNIDFSYKTMNYANYYYCGAAGIEDSRGLDGLSTMDYCDEMSANTTIHIYRPGPSARLDLWPLNYGSFVGKNQPAVFRLPLRNTGELGTDTYDLTYTSPWQMQFSLVGGGGLMDTNGNGLIDTGPIAQGASFSIEVKISPPAVVKIGDQSQASVTLRSVKNPGIWKTAALYATVPAPFAQGYIADADGAMHLQLSQPGNASDQRVSPEYAYPDYPAIIEAPNGDLISAWVDFRCVDTNCDKYVSEITYAVFNHNGQIIRPAGKLVDLSDAPYSTYDDYPALAVTPGGKVGVLWIREQFNLANYSWNENVYLAILGGSYAPPITSTNVTNNSSWNNGSSIGVPSFLAPTLAATDDNRFTLSWERFQYDGGGSPEDIFAAVYSETGSVIKNPIQLTACASGNIESHFRPNLTRLQGAKALLTWSHYYYDTENINYAVLDSSGNMVAYPGPLTFGDYNWYSYSDAVQLENGNIVIAWQDYSGAKPVIVYVVLTSNYSLVSGPTTLPNLPGSDYGGVYVSVTKDQLGHAILTWMDGFEIANNLYYALLDGSGNVITTTTPFVADPDYVGTSYYGYGNTTYSVATTAGVDTYVKAPSLAGGVPGGTVTIQVEVGNMGAGRATGVTFTADLDPSLTVLASSLPFTPSGSHYTWNLADIDPLAYNLFSITVNVPNTAIGSKYPITLHITSSGEVDTADNTAVLNVMPALQTYIPVVTR